MTSNEIRASFLDYFARNGHRIVASSPLVPAGDPTLLFTNAGMNQFKDTFLGRERRDYRRATSSQKCMRISGKHNDLENVGPSPRHHTFFEMLGNFSFGDYFKKEAIHFAWELLTEVWKLQPDRLHATVFSHWDKVALVPRDDDAYEIWKRYLASRADQRTRFGQLLADGRHGAVRPLLGGALLPRQRPALRPARVPGRRVRVRAVRRGLEQCVHGVRPSGRRHARTRCRHRRSTPAWAWSGSRRFCRA